MPIDEVTATLIAKNVVEWVDLLSLYSNIPEETIQEDFKEKLSSTVEMGLLKGLDVYSFMDFIKYSVLRDIEPRANGFIICFREGKKAGQIFEELSDLKTNIKYNLIQLLNESDVPYPHTVILSTKTHTDFDKIDTILCTFDLKDTDIYTLSHRIHEIMEMTIIKGEKHELKHLI